MKKILLITAIAFALAAIPAVLQAKKAYGKAFKAQSAQTPEQLTQALNSKTILPNVVVKGEIAQVCQAEGCWLKLKNTAGDDMLVKFKNHSFLVPKDLTGTATVYGTAVKKTISVEEQRHMAEDAGKGADELAAINTAKTEVLIEATGIVVE